MKKIMKCGTALLLALIMCLSMLPVNAFAASKQIYIWNFPLSDDTKKDSGSWGHGTLKMRFGYNLTPNPYTQARCVDSWQGEVAYCVEPAAPQGNYDTVSSYSDSWWDHMTLPSGHPLTAREMQRLIGRVMSYGYHGTIGSGWWADVDSTANKMAWSYATQILIWETIVGERDSTFKHIDVKSMGYNAVLDRVASTHPLRSKIMSYYNSIVSSVQTHSTRPSFCAASTSKADTVDLTWNGSKYTATVTDANKVLSSYNFECDNTAVSFSRSGNTLTISSTKPITSAINVTGSKANTTRAGTVIWGDGVWGVNTSGIQDVATYSSSVKDPVSAYLKIKTSAVSLEIDKTAADNGAHLQGAVYRLYDSNGNKVADATTDANGKATFTNLVPGQYSFQEISAPEGYVCDNTTYPVTVNSDTTVKRTNPPIPGEITVKKVDGAGKKLAKAQFLLESSKDDGKTWTKVSTVTTGTDGIAKWTDLKTNRNITYRVTEVKTVNGKSLLKAPLFTGTLPVTNSDGSKSYEITYTIINNDVMELPFTGGVGFACVYPLAALALMAGAFNIYQNNKTKNEKGE